MDELKLLQKLKDLEALFAGATTPGERDAAGNARARVFGRLQELAESAPPEEFQFSIADGWNRRLFLALLGHYGLRGYRRRGQRRSTVMVLVRKRFLDETLWPHFERASAELRRHLDEIAERVIEQALQTNAAEAEECEEEQRSLPFSAPDE